MLSQEKLQQEILGILASFEHAGKIELAEILAKRLGAILAIPPGGRIELSSAIKEILGRDLTADEAFKVDTLQAAHRNFLQGPHGRNFDLAKPEDTR